MANIPNSFLYSLAASAALGGALTYTCMRYYSPDYMVGRMINAFSEQLRREQKGLTPPTCFTIDRILDADCKGKTLTVGSHSCGDPKLPLSHQGIRHGQGEPIKRLLEFKKAPDGKRLDYTFEGDTCLSVTKAEKGGLRYTFEAPQVSVAKAMDPILVRNLKGIDMNSAELDAITELR